MSDFTHKSDIQRITKFPQVKRQVVPLSAQDPKTKHNQPTPKARRVQQFRGLILAWRDTPEWVTKPPLPGRGRFRARRFRLLTFNLATNNERSTRRCRWCRRPTEPSLIWHRHCVSAYWAATGNQSALSARLRADHRTCHGGQNPRCDECGSDGMIPDQQKLPLGEHQPMMGLENGVHVMELDHRDALSVAWASGNPRRMIRSLTLDNLQWLCRSCHARKSGYDRRRLHNLQKGLPEDHDLERLEGNRDQPMKTTEEQPELMPDGP